MIAGDPWSPNGYAQAVAGHSTTIGAGKRLEFRGGLTVAPGGVLDVRGGSATVGSDVASPPDGRLGIGADGVLTLNGGLIRLGRMENTSGGTFDWIGGEVALDSAVTVDSNDSLFGQAGGAALTTGQTLSCPAMRVEGATYEIAGGRLATGRIDIAPSGARVGRLLVSSPGPGAEATGDLHVGLLGLGELAVRGGGSRSAARGSWARGRTATAWPSSRTPTRCGPSALVGCGSPRAPTQPAG